jgi:hypothetical protein
VSFRIDVYVSCYPVFAPKVVPSRVYRVVTPHGEKFAFPFGWEDNLTIATDWIELRPVGASVDTGLLMAVVTNHLSLFKRFFSEVPGAPTPDTFRGLVDTLRDGAPYAFAETPEGTTSRYPALSGPSLNHVGLVLFVDRQGRSAALPQVAVVYRLKRKWLGIVMEEFDIRTVPVGELSQALTIKSMEYYSLYTQTESAL